MCRIPPHRDCVLFPLQIYDLWTIWLYRINRICRVDRIIEDQDYPLDSERGEDNTAETESECEGESEVGR